MKTTEKRLAPLTLATFLALAGFAMSGCEQDGPLENAGEEIEDAADEVGDAIDDATN